MLEIEFSVEDEVVEVAVDAAIVIALVMNVTVFYLIDASVRVGKNHWRVGRDDDLCSLLNNFFNPAQEGKLVYKRECRFGLIKNVDATALQAVLNQCNKTLAMGALMDALATVIFGDSKAIDL